MDWINIIAALLSIAIGAISWLAPRYSADALDLTPRDGSTMGLSELRASAGALFVGMGVGALLIGTPTAYIMLAACWLGAAVGRLTSLALDGQSQKKWVFFAVEASVGLLVLLANVVA